MPAYRLRIRGRVQGVGFRFSALREAKRLGLVGWVRNEFDGSVSACCEGDERLCRRFISWCENGPPMAYVEAVDLAVVPEQGLHRFVING